MCFFKNLLLGEEQAWCIWKKIIILEIQKALKNHTRNLNENRAEITLQFFNVSIIGSFLKETNM